jgi:hypothetical protein
MESSKGLIRYAARASPIYRRVVTGPEAWRSEKPFPRIALLAPDRVFNARDFLRLGLHR